MNKGQIFTSLVLEIFKVSGQLNAEGDQLTAPLGLTSARWKVLGAISLLQAPQTTSDIARYMGQSRQATQRLVDSMVADGLLELVENPRHKRAKLVNLTAAGKDAYARLDEKQIPWAQEHARGLTREELETAFSVLSKLPQQLNRQG